MLAPGQRRGRLAPAALAGLAAMLLPALLLAAAAPLLAADDPYRSQQWGLERVRAPEAWTRSLGEGIVIAVVDTGVDPTHPDLVDGFLRDVDGGVVGRDFVDDDDDASDAHGHGTMVAGVALADAGNGIGIAGVAPAARLMPVRVLDAEGGGRASDLDAGIRWAVDNGADVINLSLEEVTDLHGATGAVGIRTGGAPVEAVRYAWDRGVVVVAAAGNSGSPFTDFPSDAPVLLVGATDRDDRRAGFSDGGRRDAVMAPGVDIVSTWCAPDGAGGCDEQRYGIASGTSFAAPFVSGAIALLRSQGHDHESAVARVRQTARDLAAAGPDRQTGVGLLDISAALDVVAAEPQPGPSPSAAPLGPAGDSTPRPAATPSDPTTAPATASPSPTAQPSPQASQPDGADATPGVVSPLPAPVGAQGQEADPRRTAWVGLAVVVLICTGMALGVVVHRYGLRRQ